MLRSMFSAVSGLRNHQTRMDVIGHNIANVNTPGFKRSRVTLQEALSQIMRGSSRPESGRGGTNPMQVGLGVNIGTIDTFHTQGGLQGTGRITDLAIDGDGFFILRGIGDSHQYTRSGAFGWDSSGQLVNGAGQIVQGERFDPLNRIWGQEIGDIKLHAEDQQAPPLGTGEIIFTGNLAADGSEYTRTVTVFDNLGTARGLTFYFEKVELEEGKWNVTGVWDDGTDAGAGSIAFNMESGELASADLKDIGGFNDGIDLDFSALTQYAAYGESYMELTQDGYAHGSLVEISIDTGGVVSGVYSNGVSRPLARLVLASFINPEGLANMGHSIFAESNNSGPAQIGLAGQGPFGSISPSSLEMSNVDLAQEFTDMIITQRGFQANSRIITTSDELLQELVNLKR